MGRLGVDNSAADHLADVYSCAPMEVPIGFADVGSGGGETSVGVSDDDDARTWCVSGRGSHTILWRCSAFCQPTVLKVPEPNGRGAALEAAQANPPLAPALPEEPARLVRTKPLTLTPLASPPDDAMQGGTGEGSENGGRVGEGRSIKEEQGYQALLALSPSKHELPTPPRTNLDPIPVSRAAIPAVVENGTDRTTGTTTRLSSGRSSREVSIPKLTTSTSKPRRSSQRLLRTGSTGFMARSNKERGTGAAPSSLAKVSGARR